MLLKVNIINLNVVPKTPVKKNLALNFAFVALKS